FLYLENITEAVLKAAFNNNVISVPGCLCGSASVSCSPQAICALQDTRVKLICSYSNTNPKTVFWFSSKQKAKWRNEEHPEDLALDMDYSGRVNTESTKSSSTLTISDLRVEDSGEYHLMMVTQQGEKVLSSSAVNLTVTDLQVKEGLQAGSKALTCSTSCSLPRQRYYWYRNGQYTGKDTNYSDPYILRSGDKGSYSCSAYGYNSIPSHPLCEYKGDMGNKQWRVMWLTVSMLYQF
ncbi:hypothetical protein NFI96_032133, partial [Prochilodus magdalenae]